MLRQDLAHRGERGQILIMFTLAILVIVGMLGLVLDGGAAYAQRRAEQGVRTRLHGRCDRLPQPQGECREVRRGARGPPDRCRDGTLTASTTPTSKSHPATSAPIVRATDRALEHFASLIGMSTWDVSVTAAAETSEKPNGAIGAMPLLFNKEAFPGAICDETKGPCTPEVYQLPGHGNEDVPQDATQFNWTIFCQANGNPCNANSNGVRDLINGGGESDTIYLNDDIGPLNAGSHTTLFSALESHTGGVYPVPIVNDEREMVGFAYFKLLS